LFNFRTLKQGCETNIYVRINEKGNALIISKLNEMHDHHIFPTMYSFLLNQYKITSQTTAAIVELMDLNANKKLIQNKLLNETGKIITLKDITNRRKSSRYLTVIDYIILY
jgi:hypothetical protein